MKLKTTLIAIFGVVLFILTVSLTAASPMGLPKLELGISALARGLGATIALMAALLLLLRGAGREPVEHLTGLIAALAGGLLLFNAHWLVALVLVAVVAGNYGCAFRKSCRNDPRQEAETNSP